MHLATLFDDPEHLGAHRVTVAGVLLPQLSVAGGVEIEPFHPNPHLIRPDFGTIVHTPRCLRQDARRLDDAVQTDG
ncbi:hypothetical protein GCM10009687_81300 [Asanoa iriomotensis]